MRAASTIFVGLIAVCSFAACAPEDEAADDQTQDVTGGSGDIESPVVFLFEASADKTAAPACIGAMVGEKFAVTVKSCAKEGMSVGRAEDNDGKGTRALITKVHTPEQPGADIVVVEIDRSFGT